MGRVGRMNLGYGFTLTLLAKGYKGDHSGQIFANLATFEGSL
jgi:hypothetical protein